MAEANAAADVIIPVSVDTSGADQSIDQLDNTLKRLTATLATLKTTSIEHYEVQEKINKATSASTAANEKFDSVLTKVSKSGKKFSDDTKVMTDNITAAAAGAVSLSDSLDKTFTEIQQSGESAKEAAQGTEWYKQTLESLRAEGGLTNVTLNELKASQKDLEKAMADTQVGTEKWHEYNSALNEVKQAQTDYKNLARDTEGEMKAQSNTIAGMRQEVSRLTKEWANADMGSPQFAELSENLAKATEELKAHEAAVGKNQRDVGNYAGQIKEIIPEFTQLGEGMGLLGPVGQIAAKGVKGVATAFKALMANPIVGFFAALVVGIKAFIAITDKLATKAAEKFADAVDKETRELKMNSDALSHNVDLLRARGATAVEVANAELKAATEAATAARDTYDKFLSQYENMSRKAQKKAKETLDNLKQMADDASKNVEETAKKTEVTLTAEQTKADKERIDAAKKAAEDRVAAQKQAAAELQSVEEGITTALSDEFANRRREEQKHYEERLAVLQKNGQDTEALERLHQQNLTQIQKDEEAKRSADAAAAVAKQISDQDAAHKAEIDALNIRNAEREAAQAEVQALLMEAEALGDEQLRAAALARIEEYKILDEEAEMLQREKEAEDLQNRILLLQEGLANEQIIGAERIAMEQQVMDAKNALAINAAATAKAMADRQLNDYKAQIATQKKLDEEAAKNKQKTQATINAAIQSGINVAGEGTVAAKVLNTAQAVMSTWAGAAQALNNPFPYNLAAMAATLTAGIASVVSIWKVKVPGSSGSGGSPDISSSDVAEVKSLSTTAQYQAPIVETHSNMTGDEIEEINKAQKVYVTESDISNTQTRVSVTEGEATF